MGNTLRFITTRGDEPSAWRRQPRGLDDFETDLLLVLARVHRLSSIRIHPPHA